MELFEKGYNITDYDFIINNKVTKSGDRYYTVSAEVPAGVSGKKATQKKNEWIEAKKHIGELENFDI